MISTKFKALLQKLDEKSKANEVNWRAEAGQAHVTVSFSDYAIIIMRDKDYIGIRLLNSEGDVIDDFNITQDEKEDYQFLESLYSEARRNALKVDDALDTLDHIISQPGSTGTKSG